MILFCFLSFLPTIILCESSQHLQTLQDPSPSRSSKARLVIPCDSCIAVDAEPLFEFWNCGQGKKKKKKKRHVEPKVRPGMFGDVRECLAALFHLPSLVLIGASCSDLTLMLSDVFCSLRAFWFPKFCASLQLWGICGGHCPEGFASVDCWH